MKLSSAFKGYEENFIRFANQSNRTLEIHKYVEKNLIQYFGDIDLEDLTVEMIGQWKLDLEKSRSQNTVRCYVIKIRDVISYWNKRHLGCIDVDLIPLPKRQEIVPVFLTETEVAKMIDCSTNIRTKFVISLLYASGIRLSEFISMDIGQIVDKRFTIIGKGGKPRLCFIDERTERLMDEYLSTRNDSSRALVVSYEYKRRMTATNVQLLVRNAARRAGINKKVTPHTLRHSYATNFLKNNGNMRYLSYAMGHNSLNTTAMYAHVVNVDLEAQYRKYHTI